MSCDVKICGLTNRDDAMYALEYGADFLGFVLYSKSPRGITGNDLYRILDKMQPGFRAVAVFVNSSPEEVMAISRDCDLYAAQLHGDEDAAGFAQLDLRFWRAVRLRGETALPPFEEWDAERFVVDADVPGEFGGTGIAADWDAAQVVAKKRNIMLAGGLTPDNVAAAVEMVCPVGVDTSSGVEKEPGKKDLGKVKQFIDTVKGLK